MQKIIFNYINIDNFIKNINKIPVISPTSSFKIIWDAFILINTIIIVLHLTIFVTFYGQNVEIINENFESVLVFT